MSALAALEARIAALEMRIAQLVLAGGGTDSVRLIKLIQTGGTDGDGENEASYLYRVTDIDGNILAENIDPTDEPHVYRRMALGPYVPATDGVIVYHDDHDETWPLGPWSIAIINEVPRVVICGTVAE